KRTALFVESATEQMARGGANIGIGEGQVKEKILSTSQIVSKQTVPSFLTSAHNSLCGLMWIHFITTIAVMNYRIAPSADLIAASPADRVQPPVSAMHPMALGNANRICAMRFFLSRVIASKTCSAAT